MLYAFFENLAIFWDFWDIFISEILPWFRGHNIDDKSIYHIQYVVELKFSKLRIWSKKVLKTNKKEVNQYIKLPTKTSQL